MAAYVYHASRRSNAVMIHTFLRAADFAGNHPNRSPSGRSVSPLPRNRPLSPSEAEFQDSIRAGGPARPPCPAATSSRIPEREIDDCGIQPVAVVKAS